MFSVCKGRGFDSLVMFDELVLPLFKANHCCKWISRYVWQALHYLTEGLAIRLKYKKNLPDAF